MTPSHLFPELFAALWYRHLGGHRGRADLRPDEFDALRAGIDSVLRDAGRFDALFEFYLSYPEPGEPGDDDLPPGWGDRFAADGLDAFDDDALLRLATRPAWLAALRDRVADAAPPPVRHPGRLLLDRVDPPWDVLRMIVEREIEDALWLDPSLPSARLREWAVRRVCGAEPLPDDRRRVLLKLVGEVAREAREAAAVRAVGTHRPGGRTTLAELTRDTPLATIASETSKAGAGMAQASRKLDSLDPEWGDVILFHCYAGLPLSEVAALTRQTIEVVEAQLADASDWLRAQSF